MVNKNNLAWGNNTTVRLSNPISTHNNILGILTHTHARCKKQKQPQGGASGKQSGDVEAGGCTGGAGMPVSGWRRGGQRGGLARQSTTWQAAQQLKARLQRWEEARATRSNLVCCHKKQLQHRTPHNPSHTNCSERVPDSEQFNQQDAVWQLKL